MPMMRAIGKCHCAQVSGGSRDTLNKNGEILPHCLAAVGRAFLVATAPGRLPGEFRGSTPAFGAAFPDVPPSQLAPAGLLRPEPCSAESQPVGHFNTRRFWQLLHRPCQASPSTGVSFHSAGVAVGRLPMQLPVDPAPDAWECHGYMNKNGEGFSGGYRGSFAEVPRLSGPLSRMFRPPSWLRRGCCGLNHVRRSLSQGVSVHRGSFHSAGVAVGRLPIVAR